MSQQAQYISLNTAISSITGNSGGAVSPAGNGNINILGAGGISVVGTPGTNTLTITDGGLSANSFVTDAGTATPVAGVLNVIGGSNLGTTGAANNLTVNLDNTVSISGSMTAGTGFTATTGNVAITAGNLTLPNTNGAGTQGEITFGGNRWIHNFGGNNTFVGESAGNTTLTGFNDTGIGRNALIAITSGVSNTALGSTTLSATTSGGYNTAVGDLALTTNIIGGSNTAVGASALTASTGNYNSSFGASSLLILSTGSSNTAIGTLALSAITTGSTNIALGANAGLNLTLGNSNNIMIGAAGTAGDSARIRIGTNATHTTCFITGIDGVNVGSVAKVVTMASDQLGTATITAGTGISVVAGANTITINAVGGGDTWSTITANQTAAVNNGYFCNKAGTLALALPAASAVGDVIEVANINTATGIQFTQAANQQIFIANTSTTLGAAGTLTSSAVGDTLKIVCRTANLVWQTTSMIGNWTPA